VEDSNNLITACSFLSNFWIIRFYGPPTGSFFPLIGGPLEETNEKKLEAEKLCG